MKSKMTAEQIILNAIEELSKLDNMPNSISLYHNTGNRFDSVREGWQVSINFTVED